MESALSVYAFRSNLSLPLSSNSDLQARETANDLQRHIEREVEEDSDLSRRLENLQLSSDAIELEHISGKDSENSQPSEESKPNSESQVAAASHTVDTIVESGENSSVETLLAGLLVDEPFDVVLDSTRVYNRVKDKEIDAASTVLTTRSRAWSIISGVSLSEISMIAVIKLPLYEPELIRFQRLTSPSSNECGEPIRIRTPPNLKINYIGHLTDDFRAQYGLIQQSVYGYGDMKRITKELADMARDPPSMCSAGPIGEDLVRFEIQ